MESFKNRDVGQIPKAVEARAFILIGGKIDPQGNFYLVKRRGVSCIIQTQPLSPFKDDWDWTTTPPALKMPLHKYVERHRKHYRDTLEEIYPLLDTLDFSSHSFAFLYRPKNRRPRLCQVERPAAYNITGPIFATLIEEEEIRIVSYFDAAHQYGEWNGIKIALRMGWFDEDLKMVERCMRGHYLLEKYRLNLCFPVVGHVMCNGKVVGIATEMPTGRMVQTYDRTLVYEAAATLARHRLAYGAFNIMQVMISRGQVRLLDLAQIHDGAALPAADALACAQQFHQIGLTDIFDDWLSSQGNFVPVPQDRPGTYIVLPAFEPPIACPAYTPQPIPVDYILYHPDQWREREEIARQRHIQRRHLLIREGRGGASMGANGEDSLAIGPRRPRIAGKHKLRPYSIDDNRPSMPSRLQLSWICDIDKGASLSDTSPAAVVS